MPEYRRPARHAARSPWPRRRLVAVVGGAILLMSAAVFPAPPRVVELRPADGEVGVDPGLDELRVVFDQDMDPGGYSFVGTGPRFPAVGRPRWVNPRTCVLPLDLEPDHVYLLSLNSERHRNFRNLAGEALAPVPIVFRTGPDLSARTTPEANRQALTELRRAVDERYSHRDARGIDWDDLFARHRGAILKATSRFAFARRAAEMLTAAGDVHIRLWVDDVPYATFLPHARPNFNLALLAKTIPTLTSHGQGITTGRFEDGVGYLFIPSWRRGSGEVASKALEALLDSRALIVDVRTNNGGDEAEARRLAGHFLTEPRVYARHQMRDVDRPGGFSEPHDRVLEPSAEGRYGGRVAVLMGPVCLSSNEAFLLMMAQAPRARLFGERSYGSSGNPQPLELANGVRVDLPAWRTLLPDRTPLEGNGVPPDVEIHAGPGELLVGDPVLEKALERLRAETAAAE